MAESPAKPYWAQNTARYAHRLSYCPVLLMIKANVNGPTVKDSAIKQVIIPLRARGAIYCTASIMDLENPRIV